MSLEKLLHSLITLINNLFSGDRVLGLDVSEPSKLVKVPSKGLPDVNECPASDACEASTFDHVMPAIEEGSREVFIKRVDFEILERVNRSGTVLPYVAHYVIELSSLEIVDWVG